MEAPIHFLIFGGLLQPALRFDAYLYTSLLKFGINTLNSGAVVLFINADDNVHFA